MPSDPDPLAAELARMQALTDAATDGPWLITEKHGRDIADEAWSDVRITGPGGEQIMLAYLTGILEPGSPSEDADPDFVIAARSLMPRMLKALRRINALADQWHGDRGNDYSASALYASKLREVLEEELLSEGGARG
jgi:hypothetical protein